MRSLAATLAICGLMLSACTDNSGINFLPAEKRSEAKIRKKECDALSASVAPSRDRSRGFSIMGFGLNFRNATLSQSSAKDQYLVAIQTMISACRRWQRFADSDENYREAQIRAAKIVESTVDVLQAREALDRFLNAVAEAKSTGSEGSDALAVEIGRLREEFDAWRAPIDIVALENRLRRIEDIVANSTNRGEGSAVNGGNASEGSKTSILHPKTRNWVIHFATDSSVPLYAETDQAVTDLRQWLRGCASSELQFFGYADETGGSDYNLSLAKRRAVAVRLRFAEFVNAEPIASSVGETAAFGGEFSANRVVVVRASCVPRAA